MPTSNLHQISDIVELIVAVDPRFILDGDADEVLTRNRGTRGAS